MPQSVLTNKISASELSRKFVKSASVVGWGQVYRVEARNVDGRALDRHRLVGLFPIHRSDCRTVLAAKSYNGFQRAEAMAFAVELVNEQVWQTMSTQPISL